MLLKLMLHKLLLMEDLELEMLKSMKVRIILILYIKRHIVFVEEEFIVHLIEEIERYDTGVKIQNKEYYFTFMYRVILYQVRICGGWVVFGDFLHNLNAKKFDYEIRSISNPIEAKIIKLYTFFIPKMQIIIF